MSQDDKKHLTHKYANVRRQAQALDKVQFQQVEGEGDVPTILVSPLRKEAVCLRRQLARCWHD
jgi:hypothetical protein